MLRHDERFTVNGRLINKKNRKHVYYILICVFAFSILLMTGCKKRITNVSIDSFILHKVDGLSGRADAVTYLDTNGIYTKLTSLHKKIKPEQEEGYRKLVDSMSIQTDRLTNLANDDVITVTVTYDTQLAESLRINLTDCVKNITITGLDVGTEIDVFKDLKVYITGTAPYAFASYSNESENPFIKNLSYEFVSDVTNLENGDIVKIKCNLDADIARQFLYYTDVTEKEYTVEGLDRFIYDQKEIDREALNEIINECEATIKAETDDTTTRMLYRLTGNSNYLYQDNNEWVDYISTESTNHIFLSKKPGSDAVYENIIILVFAVGLKNNYYSEDGFFLFQYTNGVLTSDGKFMIGRNNSELRYVCGTDFGSLYDELTGEIIHQYEAVFIE